MCDAKTSEESQRKERKQSQRWQREGLIRTWMEEDRSAGRVDLSGAFAHWRDDLVKRIDSHRPRVVRLPGILAEARNLKSRDVLIDLANAVWILKEDGKSLDVMLVPPQH